MLLGIDYGDARTGLALSDALGLMALPYETLSITSAKKLVSRLKKICDEKNIEKIILGLPLNMNGTEGERANKTREFGEKLKEATDLPVCYFDERLSSKIATQSLHMANTKNIKNFKDSVAACIILQSYMDANK